MRQVPEYADYSFADFLFAVASFPPLINSAADVMIASGLLCYNRLPDSHSSSLDLKPVNP